MSGGPTDRELDELLGAALALTDRGPDPRFLGRVEAAIAEADRYRRWQANMLRQLTGELLALAGLAGALAVIAQAPGVGEALAEAPTLVWPAMLAMLLLWMILIRGPSRLLA